ncbi:MAG: FAD-dependent oxidoreductase, partial [Desulfacinum sp.]|nr:FAD-dependent oxidoreductase [Desulfacinum sp.]
DFLREVNLGNRLFLGDRVAVVGGGNVAMDCVRTALRTGSKKPFIVYRRSLEEMPANEEEIEECHEEGIEIHTLVNPVRILGENGKVKAIECVRMELGEPDASGRRRPVPVEGSNFILEVDAVIPAIGQESDWACLTPECACSLSDWRTLQVDPVTLQSDDPDIFAGGDAVTGPATVIEAIAAGKEAAVSIHRFIQGEDLREGRERTWEPVRDVPTEGYDRIPRERMPRLSPQERQGNFNEVQLGFTEEQVRREATRCLDCGICSECYRCVDACLADAVVHEDAPRERELEVGAIVLAPGFQPFDPAVYDTYAYTRLPNVLTAMEFERLLSASGPTMGHVVRPSDEKEPKKIAWLQCVGSRDIHHCDHAYCSGVCCMYAIKEAVIAKEHAGKELEAAIFFMDMRTHGKDFERYYNRAKEEHGVRFIRSRVHSIEEVPGTGGDLEIHYVDEEGRITSEVFDLVVLSVGLETPEEAKKLAERLDVRLNDHLFAEHSSFEPVAGSRPGIYVCGAFQGPKDIPQSVMEASAAAAAAGAALAPARHSRTRVPPKPAERDVSRESPRIGVFVCHCGINIGGVVDVTRVADYARSLPHVVHVEDNLFTCSQDTQVRMTQVIHEKRLNRIVVAACSPRTHEALFQETLAQAGLNKYLLEMANIRNLDSWVHGEEKEEATRKAQDMVRMAVAKATLLTPLQDTAFPVVPAALVVGAGVAGMTAALNLATHGYPVHLVEKNADPGGTALRLYKTWRGEPVSDFVDRLKKEVLDNPKIQLHLNAAVTEAQGFVGNFRTTIRENGAIRTLDHGVLLIATGAREHKPAEYLYGEDPAVVTNLELDERLRRDEETLRSLSTATFIQCVGSRDEDHPYCSRVCCSHTIRNALELKALNPEMRIFVIYRDMRTFGLQEEAYQEARRAGVLFFRYDPDHKPRVNRRDGALTVQVRDPILGRMVEWQTDLLCLAAGAAAGDNRDLARIYKLPLDKDGWFQEAHQKLRPVDFSTEGIFLCGMAHYPKALEESVAQALAASAKALGVLTRDTVTVGGIISRIDPERCTGCGLCLEICPFGAIQRDDTTETARVNPALCKGCGACAAACPAEAPAVQGFTHRQMVAQIKAALAA